MSDKKLKGVCIGAGYFAQFQYEAWNRIPEVSIVANANRSLEKAQNYASKYNIPKAYSFDQVEDLIDKEKPDFLDVITPPETHLEICKLALKHNIHVICQKPVAPTWNECLEISKLVQESNARFMVHENWRWQPWYREIKNLLDYGAIGEPSHAYFQCRMGDGWGEDAYLARQPFFRDYPRLFIYETGVHFLDTFRFLFGEVESIYTKTKKHNEVIQGEDCAIIFATFQNGTTAILDANRYNESISENPRYTFGTLRLDGSEGHLEMNTDGEIYLKKLGEDVTQVDYTPSRSGFAGDCVYAVQRHFVDSMIQDQPFESEISDYLKSILLVEEAYQSAQSNQVIKSQSSELNHES